MHRPFTDSAGYTRHCWECKHAHGWEINYYDKYAASCDTRSDGCFGDLIVGKNDSPNNPSSIAAGCEHYEH